MYIQMVQNMILLQKLQIKYIKSILLETNYYKDYNPLIKKRFRLLYLTELILQLNNYSIIQLTQMLIGAQKPYQFLINAIIKCKPKNQEIIPVLQEEINNIKQLYELQTLPAQQLYYRPIYNENYDIIREIRVKKVKNYVIKEDTITDVKIAQQRISNWINISQKHHPNLLNLKAAIIQKNICRYLTDYIDGITLDKFSNRKLFQTEKTYIIQQMIESVKILHSNYVVHGDIKPSNFMVTSQFGIVLMDLDQLGQEGQQADMTYLYTFKEQDLPSYHGDIWSLGLCIYTFWTGQRIEKNWTIQDYKKRDFIAMNIDSYGIIEDILDACLSDPPKEILFIKSLSKQL